MDQVVNNYLLITLIIVQTIVVSSGIPLMYPLCFVCMLIMYNLSKLALFRERPYLIKVPTEGLATKAINYILVACVLHLAFGLFALFDSTFKDDSFDQIKNIFLQDFQISNDERKIQL